MGVWGEPETKFFKGYWHEFRRFSAVDEACNRSDITRVWVTACVCA